MKKLKMIILGFGQRGQIYGNYALKFPQEYEIAAIVDNDEEKLKIAKGRFPCPVFGSYENMLAANIHADLIAIATQDIDHEKHAVACLEKGYDLLLEKPISNTMEGCRTIYAAAIKYERKVIVCHVLRYTPFYQKLKQIIDSGSLGDIITVSASENVGYYHQAHSFVRGLWRNKEQSSPMILAKCCHDMDILRWLIGKPCQSVSSMGSLKTFRKENAPKASADYCSDCKDTECIYKAQTLYTDKSKTDFTGYFLSPEKEDENVLSALRHTQYDRCVFKCDNDVVDHEVTIMQFEDDVTAMHSMTAFSKDIYRDIKIHGTKAELVGIMEKNYIEVRQYGGDTQVIPLEKNVTIGGHGGGDQGLMHAVYLALNGEETKSEMFLNFSIESHFMAFGAEKSRLSDAMPINLQRL